METEIKEAPQYKTPVYVLKATRAYYDRNRASICERQRAYYQDNREKLVQKARDKRAALRHPTDINPPS